MLVLGKIAPRPDPGDEKLNMPLRSPVTINVPNNQILAGSNHVNSTIPIAIIPNMMENDVKSPLSSTPVEPQQDTGNYDTNAAEFLAQYSAMVDVLRMCKDIEQNPALTFQSVQYIKKIMEKQLTTMTDYGVDKLALLFQVKQQAIKSFNNFINSQMIAPNEWVKACEEVMSRKTSVSEAAKKCKVGEDVIKRLVKRLCVQKVFRSAEVFENSVRNMCDVIGVVQDREELNATATEASLLDQNNALSDAKLNHITNIIRNISCQYLTDIPKNDATVPVVRHTSPVLNFLQSNESKPVQNILFTTPEGVIGVLPVSVNCDNANLLKNAGPSFCVKPVGQIPVKTEPNHEENNSQSEENTIDSENNAPCLPSILR